MASIYKRTGRKNESYTIQYLDHLGKRRTRKGFTDKGLSEELAAKLETEARLRSTGLVDPELDRYAELKRVPLADHVSAFKASLADNSQKHVVVTMARIQRIVEGCGFTKLDDLQPEPIQTFLRTRRESEDMSRRTFNHYIQAINSFCNWCIATKRLLTNPLSGLERLNTEVDIRRQRRALTAEEVGRLVASARANPKTIDGVAGEQRARIYLLAYMTGLRKSELASLSPQSFDLNAEPPTVTVEAACSKHRRRDVLPLHPEIVAMLREWLVGLAPKEKLFPKLASRETALMVKADLERVGIPFRTDAGVADFHAAGRHTHITELLRNGVSLPEAKELARHSDVKMTMKYTHIGIADQARAVANLPSPRSTASARRQSAGSEPRALQMRCVSGGAGCQDMATSVIGGKTQSKQKSPKGRNLGSGSHRAAFDDKVPEVGLEPTPCCQDWILSPARLPFRHSGKELELNSLRRKMRLVKGDDAARAL